MLLSRTFEHILHAQAKALFNDNKVKYDSLHDLTQLSIRKASGLLFDQNSHFFSVTQLCRFDKLNGEREEGLAREVTAHGLCLTHYEPGPSELLRAQKAVRARTGAIERRTTKALLTSFLRNSAFLSQCFFRAHNVRQVRATTR